ncbi:sodium/glucose cotransporter 4-like [Acanthaster planci]|uniref:Sodium/myo-inositol cotransporter 2 n=1 Tax=Acanthaster planci TaxID=133434 RepID=A0A8B7ZU96_ACAPL|nr:sodium/glucose cotransporter 4-like [Acanthaster planci]XP_022108995.1 sodium/glucose cotransporter 4-like [Acanthaster planci]
MAEEFVNRMEPADYAIISVYFLFVVAVGLWSMYRSNRTNAQGYFLAGKTMSWWPVGASLFASNIGTGHFIGLAGTGAASGLAVGLYETMAVWCLILLGWVFVPVYLSSGVYTMPEYLRKRYGGQRLRILMAVFSLFLYIFTKISVDIFAGAIFIQLAFNWNLYTAIIVLLVVTAIYTITGGLAAVIYTDALQSFIMVAGGIVLMVISYIRVGGMDRLMIKYSQAIPSATLEGPINATCGYPRSDAFNMMRHPLASDQPWPGALIGITFIGVWYWCSDQVIVQRALAARNMTHVKGASILAGYLKLLPLFMIVIPGMIARVLFTDDVACASAESCKAACGSEVGCSNIAYPRLVLELLPTGLRGLMVAVMMAALMSSLTSIFNSGSTVFTMDIWRRIRPRANNAELMIVGRLFIVVLLGVSIVWIPVVQAAQGGQLFIYIQSLQSYFAPPVFTCFVMGVAWGRINEKGAFWGLLCGIVLGVVRMVLDIVYPAPACGDVDTRPSFVAEIHFLYYNCIVGAVSISVTVGVSLLTKKLPDEYVLGMTFLTRGLRRSNDTGARVDQEKDIAEDECKQEPMNLEESMKVKSVPLWRKGIYWFCGYAPEARDAKVPELIASLDEKRKWRIVLLINALVLFGASIVVNVIFW